MNETLDLVRAWKTLPAGEPALLATIVATNGSTYRKAGARMLLSRSGWLAGSISGGCLEGDVMSSAWSRTEEGPVLVTYDATAEDDIVWGFGLGCNGVVQVLLERLPEDGGILRLLAEVLESRQPIEVRTVVSEGPMLGNRAFGIRHSAFGFEQEDAGEAREEDWAQGTAAFGHRHSALGIGTEDGGRAGLADGSRFIVENDGQSVLVESIFPPRKLYIFGAGHDAVPLAELALGLGFSVVVADHREAYLSKLMERVPSVQANLVQVGKRDSQTIKDSSVHSLGDPEFEGPGDSKIQRLRDLPDIEPDAAAVVMSHHYLDDLAVLRHLLDSKAGYIGLMGPRRRADRMLAELGPLSPKQEAVLRSPVGLDIGAEGPDEIALSIVAEIQAFFKGSEAGYLNGKEGPLHDSVGVKAS